MARDFQLRDADPERDAAALRAIYAPHITDSAVSFELTVPSAAEMARRVAEVQEHWVWLVAEVEGDRHGGEPPGPRIAGYAYGGPHRTRAAYDLTVETSVYLDERFHGRGLGRALYLELFERLAALGFCQAFAGATLPHPTSVAFHEALGFRVVGTFPRIGYKFGRYHDVIWMHRELRAEPLPGASPLRRKPAE